MRDWKAVAAGLALAIPEEQLERIGPALDGLETEFRPLARIVSEDVEPAVVFRAEEGEA